jgi:hypothetical protein
MTIDEITSQNGRTQDDMDRRAELVDQVDALIKEHDWCKAAIARRAGIGHGTFSQWHSGNYRGRYDTINATVATWLGNLGGVKEIQSAVPVAPDYLPLDFALTVERMCSIAQIMGTMVMITAEAGVGKTMAGRQYVATHANTWYVPISPHTRTVHNMLAEIVRITGIDERNAGRFVHAIGKRVQKTGDGTLLVIDEAQNLSDEAINQLRHFADNYGCGIALLGNTATYARLSAWGKGDKYAQLSRRIFKRVKQERPTPDDIASFIGAWGVEDPDMVEFLVGVGMKPGALGQVDMTIKLARMAAQGGNRALTLRDLRAAWSNRDVEVE